MLGREQGSETEAHVSGSWATSMQAALAASAGRPAWWVMALAAFLVRGGILVVLLPLVSLPSAPALATAFAPAIEAVAISRQSLEAALLATLLVASFVAVLALAAYAGSWLDLALVREAEASDELDLRQSAHQASAWQLLGIRLAAHLPSILAIGYGAVRIVVATYQELLSPGDPTVPIALRVIARAPDAIVIAVVAWLLGEAIGGLAARRSAEGETAGRALRGAVRDLLARRGVATFVVTDLVVLAVVVLLVSVVGRAAEHVRVYLFDVTDPVSLAAALLLLVAAWVLGLAVLGAALAWRATAWTIEAAPRREPAAAPATTLESESPAREAPIG
jgi:hypothetical protein